MNVANITLDEHDARAGNTQAAGAALDVTNDVLGALNQSLPNVATTAPAAPAQQQQQPQGR